MKKSNILFTIIIISKVVFGMEQTDNSLLCKELSLLSYAMLRTGGQAVVRPARLITKSGQSLIGKRSIVINQADQNYINNKLTTLFTRDTNK